MINKILQYDKSEISEIFLLFSFLAYAIVTIAP